MKRIALVLFIALVAFAPAFAQGINLGNFPLGTWLDANYDAVWEFSSGNIRILAPDGTLHFDFSAEGIQDFKVGAGGDGPFITFSCAAVGKSYKLTKPLLKPEMTLEITRTGLPAYSVVMAKR
ncbi:MAG TPA: hypothetical protein DCG47_04615 [Spirochaetaceae bacterium]|jgi:hypothetical protein|nr:hypothetical protein [Spirochaetaceae bacterium]